MVKRATGFGSMEDLLFLASNLAQLHKILFRPFETYTIGIWMLVYLQHYLVALDGFDQRYKASSLSTA